jgi:hypothetical protein
MEKKFTNNQFKWTFESIGDNMPTIMLTTIILTYGINAYLTAIFLPLPFLVALIASVILQLGRFAVVFMDFLNPTDTKSAYPPRIALGATVVALIELFFGLQKDYQGYEFISMFLFVGTIICFGYLLEINFVNKGIEAYGIGVKPVKRRRRESKPKPVTKNNEVALPKILPNFINTTF